MKMKNRLFGLLLSLALVLGLLPCTALPARADGGITHSGFTATGGTEGAGTNEEYGSLVDGDKDTKWCVTSLKSPTYIEFHSDRAITPTGYILTTGGDTAAYPGRNPASWTIKAKVNENDADWTTLTTVTEDTVLGAKNTTDYRFALGNTAEYQYFRFEINSIKSGSVFQLAEFQFISGVDLYHDLDGYGTLTGTGFYKHTGSEITPLYTVRAADGTLLTEDTDYSVTITKDGNTVATVQEKGDYVLKVTGIYPYTGTKELTFTVGDGYKYIDTDDTEKNCELFTVLTGGGRTTLSSGWYVVNRSIEYSDTITIDGDVHIILVNGKTLTVDTVDGCFVGANGNDSLNIYAQSSGISAGTLNATTAQLGYARAVKVKSLVLNGGNLNFYGRSDSTVVETGNLAFNGGNVNIDGGEGGLYFSTSGFNFKWRSASDSFYAKKWTCNGFTFEKPVKCIDNSNAYIGAFHTDPNYSSPLDGKKLVPATLSDVTLADMSNGSVTKSDASLQSGYFDGETVTLSIAPESGYLLSSLNVTKTDDNTQVVPVNGSGNTRTFTMPAYPVIVTAVFVENTEPFEVTLEDFDTVFEDYAVPDAKTITLHSFSESVMIESVTIDNIEEFELNKTDGITLAAGGTDTSYTIWPKDGLTAGEHTAIVTINYGDSKTVTAETSFVVKPHELTVSAPGVSERDYVEGYTNTYQSIIFITNSGSEQKTIKSVSLSGADADCFSLESRHESINIPAENTDQSNYLIRPATGKSAGTYTAVLNVTCNDGETATTQVKFKVLSPIYDMSVTAPTFDLEYYDGYFPMKNVVITYTGNIETEVTSIKLEGTDADKFTMSGSLTEIFPWYYNNTLVPSVYDREIYIRPKTDLPAGTYNAKITVVNGGGVSASDEFSFTVGKATPVISKLPVASEITYGQNLSESSLTGGIVKSGEKVVAGQFSWETGTTEPAVSDSNSTEYEVLFTPTDTENYETVSCNVKIKVNMADIVVSGITTPTPKTLTYTGSAQELVTAGTAEGGTMQYALGTATEATQPYTTSIPTATNAGTYYVYYKVIGDGNHLDSEVKSVPVNIEPAVPDYTVPTDLSAEVGTEISEIKLPEGFSFKFPEEEIITIGDNSFAAVYTPEDTANYNAADVTITVKGIGIHHEAVAATCEKDGTVEYWEDGLGSKFSDENGKNVLTDKQIVIEKLGHEWSSPVWNWTSDTKANVTLTCTHDKKHTKTVDAAVGVVVTEEPTEEKEGVRTYTAKVTVDGIEYTTTRTETIPKTEPTPSAPTPDVPTPDVPTPDDPTPEPTPVVPTPDEPTPEPTPVVPTQDEPTPKPTPDDPTPTTPDEPTKEISGILGDVNDDGVVDSTDALLILRNSIGLETFDETQNFLGDVNFDDTIDSADALSDLRFSVSLIDNEKIGQPISKTVA